DWRSLTSGTGGAPDFRGIFGFTSQSGFYVHRADVSVNPCSADFEGGLAPLPNGTGPRMVGVGYVTVAADPAHGAFFLADSRAAEGEGLGSGVGVFRTTTANLNNTSICPDGTLTETQSAACIPAAVLVAPTGSTGLLESSPSLAVDEGRSGD